MTQYIASFQSGVVNKLKAKTLLGAKREATKDLTYGGGNVYITDEDDYIICYRQFWQDGDKFGWTNWTVNY